MGAVFGLVYFGLVLRWLMPFGAIAEWPLVAVQTAFVAAFGALAGPVLRRVRGIAGWALIAAIWTATDWLRATWPAGGFTWGGLGYTQHGNPAVLKIASIGGVWAVTFIVVLVNGLLIEVALRTRAAGEWRPALRVGRVANWLVAAPLLLAIAVVVLPVAIPSPRPIGQNLDVAVVQGSVPLALASDRLLQTSEVAASHIRLHRTLSGRPPQLAVWPENALADDPTVDAALGRAVGSAIRDVGSPTLVGAIRALPDGRYANQTLLYSGRGDVLGRYTKVHLVPFGEYVPWPGLFGWTERYRRGNVDLVPGSSIRVFHVAGTTVGTPICFENAFPDLFRRFVALGAEVMIVTTNDSSFLFTEASREHVILSQLRAVETGRWVVQAAISGESAVIDPLGRVVARTDLFQRTVLRASVPTGTGRTLYVRFGDWFPKACVAVAAIALVALMVPAIRRRRRARRGSPDPAAPPVGEGRSLAPISGASDPRVLVVLPTYEERVTIGTVLEQVTAIGPNVHVLVVDDGSPDGTGDVVEAIAEVNGQVRLLRRPGKAGLASAYLTGFRAGLDEGYEVIVEMDADLSHRPQDLPSLIDGASRFDLTIGSRYVPGGAVTNWSRSRVALSRAGNAYARAMLRIPVTDATSGFRAYRRDLLAVLVERGVTSEGYGFQIELVLNAHRMGYRIGEVPITFREREHGQSKISRGIVLEALVKVATWGVHDRFSRDGRRASLSAGDGRDAPTGS
jgi:apolipoprotein N-acyltransferase